MRYRSFDSFQGAGQGFGFRLLLAAEQDVLWPLKNVEVAVTANWLGKSSQRMLAVHGSAAQTEAVILSVTAQVRGTMSATSLLEVLLTCTKSVDCVCSPTTKGERSTMEGRERMTNTEE